MQSLDQTIANVALPYMQGSFWPASTRSPGSHLLHHGRGDHDGAGRLAGRRFGRKRLFVVCIIGFTFASMMCGAAQSLEQIVLFRLLQGMFSAALVPLSQATLLDIYPPSSAASPWRSGAWA